MQILRFVLALVAFVFGWATIADPVSAQDNCTPIRFARGTSSIVVTGVAPPEGVLCYTLTTLQGQTATVRVVDGPNIMFSIAGVVDGQDAHQFRTRRTTYRILVSQLMRSVSKAPFRLFVEVVGTPTRNR